MGSAIAKSNAKVEHAFSNFGHTIDNDAKAVWGEAKTVVNTVYGDAKSGISAAGNLVLHTEDQVAGTIKGVVNKTGDTISGLGNNVQGIAGDLSTPLLIGAAVLGIYMISNSNNQGSRR